MLTSFLAVAGGLYILHQYNVGRSADLLKARAEAHVESKNLGAAIDFYSRYLIFRPGDTDARAEHAFLLADTAGDAAARQRAYLALERVLRENPDDPAARRRAADVALAMDQPAEARYHLELLLKATPKNAELLEQLGSCEERAGQMTAAAGRYRQAMTAAPDRVSAYTRLAAALRRTGRSDEADAAMNEMVARNPESARALLARATYLKDLGLLVAAAGDVAAIRTRLRADSAEVELLAAEVAEQQRRFDDARAGYTNGRAKYPNDQRFVVGLIRLDLGTGRREDAVRALRQAVAAPPDRAGELWQLADMCVTAGLPAEARGLTARLGRDDLSQVAVDYLEARLHMADQNWTAAAALLDRTRPRLVRLPDLLFRAELLLAECHARLDRPDRWLEAARRAVDLNPIDVAARVAVADAKVAAGAVAEAVDDYRRLADTVPHARERLIRLLVWQNQARGAAADWSEADRLLAATAEEVRITPGFRLAAAGLAAARGDRAEARKQLEAGTAAHPTEVRLWAGLALLVGAADGPAAADAVLDRATADAGDGVELRLVKAEHCAAQRAADRLKGLEVGADRFPPADRDRLEIGLADAYQRVQQPADARRLLDALVARRPAHVPARSRLVELAAAAGDAAAVAAQADALRAVEGEDGVLWRYADALRHTLAARKERSPAAAQAARSRLAELTTRRPNWAQVPRLEGELDELAGSPEAAVEKYQRAVRLGDRGPVVARAARLLVGLRRFDDARRLLAEAVAGGPDAARLEAEIAILRNEDPARTADLLARAVPADSDDPRDLVWRGLALAAVNRPTDAEAAFRRATAVAPAEPVGWVALVEFLARANRPADAKASITAAAAVVPPARRPRTLAPCHAAVGDRAAAATEYEAATRQDPADPQLARELAGFHMAGGEADKAEAVLRGLIDRTPDPVQAAWARRTLALLWAGRGDYARGTEALALLDRNLQAVPGSPEDQRARALILIGRPGGRVQSIRLLEESFVRLRPTADEEFLLAQLYEAAGDWRKAKERLLALAAGPGAANPAYLGQLVRGLIRQKETAEAADWLARLEALPGAAGGPRAVELKARLLAAVGRGDEAGRLLLAFADRATADKPQPGVFRAVGLLAAELGQPAAGEALLRRYVSAAGPRAPTAALELAELVARQGRAAEALGLVQPVGRLDPEAAARSVVAVVRLSAAGPADGERAAAMLAELSAAAPASADIRLSAADLLDARGQYDAAIAAYRAILAGQPANPLALNNLAWLLALHDRNPTEALARVDEAISRAGPVDIYLDTRGVALLRAGKTTEAIRAFTTAAEQSLRPDVLFHLAAAYQTAGDVPEAQRWMRKAGDLGLTERDVHPLEREAYQRLAVEVSRPPAR